MPQIPLHKLKRLRDMPEGPEKQALIDEGLNEAAQWMIALGIMLIVLAGAIAIITFC